MTDFGAVHQFHAGTAVGDAITNQMLALQRHMQAAGYYSEIYAQHIPDALHPRVRHIDTFEEMPSTLLVVHHSMGYTAFEQVMRLSTPMVTVFHSITPERFFDDADTRSFVRLGFQQLHRLAGRSLFGVADSNHNRRQMYDAGFRDVDVLPVRTDFQAHRAAASHRQGVLKDWLFVGRIVPNKRQLEIVRAFAAYHATFGDANLHLVGDRAYGPYVNEVTSEIARLGVGKAVAMHGKLSDEELLVRYRDAGLFVCLSEHEGFGVPILEAMAAQLPVIARPEAAVAETMGGAGVLIETADPRTVASVARLIATDAGLRDRLIRGQERRMAQIESFDVPGFLRQTIRRAASGRMRSTLQVQGPFETSYSLATLNRELAVSLHAAASFDVSIQATEGPGDYTPDATDLARYLEATALYRPVPDPYPDVAIRQMYPPRVHDSVAGMLFQYFGWEESLLPSDIATDFERHVDGIGTMSQFVIEVLRDSGVTTPCAAVGVGVTAPDPSARFDSPELVGLRSIRFLSVSSAFPRKGIDVLLRSYFDCFSGSDDVSLILKTFPNPHNSIGDLLDELQTSRSNPPHVCWINRDLAQSDVDGLYARASHFVHTARGEGFGLPVAEAMLARLPVISVASAGLADFVSDDTAAVVGHTVEAAATHLSVPGSMWFEPDAADLREHLRSAAAGTDAARRSERVETAFRLISQRYTWPEVARRWIDFIEERRRRRQPLQVALVSTFNSRCGIAEYSASLFAPIAESTRLTVLADVGAEPLDPDVETGVRRVWRNHRQPTAATLLDAIDASQPDVVHLQHNMGFLTAAELGQVIERASERSAVVVTLHRTSPLHLKGRDESVTDVADQLRMADAIVVHQLADRDRLAAAGVTHNVRVLPIGAGPLVETEARDARHRHRIPLDAFVVGTYGFMLPHKGMIPLLQAVALLRDQFVNVHLVAGCALHPDPSSLEHLTAVRAEIDRLKLNGAVSLVTEYLPTSGSLDLLACSDVIALPYAPTSESSSAALRSMLPVGRPIVATDLPIFADARDVICSISSPVAPHELANVLADLWLSPVRRRTLADAVARRTIELAWPAIARQTNELYHDILSARGGAIAAASATAL